MELKNYEQPSVTVDIIIFTINENKLKILLVKRNQEPFKNMWAIPGGFVRIHESLDSAALRELKEETGIGGVYLEQLYSFGEVNRDPRGRVITIAYFALVDSSKAGKKLKATTDVSEAKWFPVKNTPKLAFDHQKILNYAIQRVRWKFEYTTIGLSLLPKKFTLTQLQKIYEIVFNKKFDKRNFRKKIFSLGILKESGINDEAPHRPPKLFSLKKSSQKIVEII